MIEDIEQRIYSLITDYCGELSPDDYDQVYSKIITALNSVKDNSTIDSILEGLGREYGFGS